MEICEVKIRNEFFLSTLFVENTITSYLSEKLKITNSVNSNFLGNKQGSISFDQKIDALLESNDFSIIDKSKLSVYKEINNELILNKNICSFEDCFTSSDHNDDFLLILYPQNEYLPREEKLTNACYQLIGEVSLLVSEYTNMPEVKLKRKTYYFNMNNLKIGKYAFLFSFLFLLR
jgi:hypothetical protein